jgi:hypothetical protein
VASITTVAIGVILVTVGAHHLVETRVADALQCRLDAKGEVEVQVGLLDSLPAVVSGHVGDVRIQVPAMSLGEYTGRFEGHLTGLRTAQSPLFHRKSPVTTAGGTATVTLAYNELKRRLANVTSVGADKGQLIVHVDSDGRKLIVRFAVSYGRSELRIVPKSVQIGTETVAVRLLRPLVQRQSPQLARQFDPRVVPIRLQTVQPALTISGVRAASDGLEFAGTLKPGTLKAQTRCT